MRLKTGQASIEYLILLASLLLILIAFYALSVQMSQRQQLLASQMEGERVAARLSRAIDNVLLAGPNATTNLSLASFPNQTVIVYGAEVLAYGPDNQTLAIAHALANATSSQTTFNANQNVEVNYKNSTTVVITALGS